jgi:hypothetical protein
VKLLYSAPVGVYDSLEEPIRDASVLEKFDGLSCLEGTVLDYLDEAIPNRELFKGGYLRLHWDGKKLLVQIEIESPEKLKKTELKQLQDDLEGQVSDGIGEGAFDFVSDETELSILTFTRDRPEKRKFTQSDGTVWSPGEPTSEEAANRNRCMAAQKAFQALEKAAEVKASKSTKKKAGPPNPKKLAKLLVGLNQYPKPTTKLSDVEAEIAALGGDLSFIGSGVLPYERYHDLKLLQLLLDSKLNPNLHDREGHSLLSLTIGDLPCVKLMIDHGADVNFRDTYVYQSTPLMEAARLGQIETVQLLLEKGANPKLLDFFKRSALDLAKAATGQRGTKRVAELLEAAMKPH